MQLKKVQISIQDKSQNPSNFFTIQRRVINTNTNCEGFWFCEIDWMCGTGDEKSAFSFYSLKSFFVSS